jgi:hypothetical protein
MNLVHECGCEILAGKLREKTAAILLHALRLVAIGESEIQSGARSFARAAFARAERMHEPRVFAELG